MPRGIQLSDSIGRTYILEGPLKIITFTIQQRSNPSILTLIRVPNLDSSVYRYESYDMSVKRQRNEQCRKNSLIIQIYLKLGT